MEPVKPESPAALAQMSIGELELVKESQRTILHIRHYTGTEHDIARENMHHMDTALIERGELPSPPRGVEDHLNR